jgi:tetratricopeptide (TPR) repeat protein
LVTQVRRRIPRFATALLILTAGTLGSLNAHAAHTFVARADRTEVPLDDSFVVEISLVSDEGSPGRYRAPSFKGLRILSEQPSQSHQIRFGGGATVNQMVFTWRYELAPTNKGTLTIEAAQIELNGNTLRTNAFAVSVTDAAGASSRQQRQGAGRSPFGSLFGAPPRPRRQPTQPSDGGESFLRAVPTKTTVYVGEQLTVTWSAYFASRVDNYNPIKDSQTDGFWVESLPGPSGGRLQIEQQEFEGKSYLVGTLKRAVLFPLHAGTLQISPMQAEISSVDFFGTQVQSETIASKPVSIEVLPLPAAGRPADFDGSAVGTFNVTASVDRKDVKIGEAVSLVVSYSGQGNIQKLPTPTLPDLPGWKRYEPKVNTEIQRTDFIAGEKKVEFLLLPEKPGTVRVPAFELPYFDPQESAWRVARSEPIELVAIGDAAALATTPNTTQGAIAPGTVVENVVPTELRPVRGGGRLRRDLGTTFYRSTLFPYLLFCPPLLFGLTIIGRRLRTNLGRDTERGRNRALRRFVRQRLGAAQTQLESNNPGALFGEIERVLREVLTARLKKPVAGLSRDELATQLIASGMPDQKARQIIEMFERCDQARFSAGAIDSESQRKTLDEAALLIELIEQSRKGASPVAAIVFFGIASLFGASPAQADVLDSAWNRGNDAYQSGDYAAARTAYEEIDRQGVVSSDLYYNLGVSHFRLGDLGRATWNFERALALDPEDDDASFNLKQVRKLLAQASHDKIEGGDVAPLWIRVVTQVSPSMEAWLFVTLYLIVFALLFLRLRAPSEARTGYNAGIAVSGLLAVLAGVLLFGRVSLDHIPFGIVLPKAVDCKDGADSNYRTSFTLHAGLRVRIVDQDTQWVRIRLHNGLEGWVPENSVGRL